MLSQLRLLNKYSWQAKLLIKIKLAEGNKIDKAMDIYPIFGMFCLHETLLDRGCIPYINFTTPCNLVLPLKLKHLILPAFLMLQKAYFYTSILCTTYLNVSLLGVTYFYVNMHSSRLPIDCGPPALCLDARKY